MKFMKNAFLVAASIISWSTAQANQTYSIVKAEIHGGDLTKIKPEEAAKLKVDLSLFQEHLSTFLKNNELQKYLKEAKSLYMKAFEKEDAISHLTSRGWDAEKNFGSWTKMGYEVGNTQTFVEFTLPLDVNCLGQPTKIMKIETENNDDVEYTVSKPEIVKGEYSPCT